MAIVVVGGSTKDIGKTALVCAIISALRRLRLDRRKDYRPQLRAADTVDRDSRQKIADPTVWEETNPGQETDTARYLAAGARRALLVTRLRP